MKVLTDTQPGDRCRSSNRVANQALKLAALLLRLLVGTVRNFDPDGDDCPLCAHDLLDKLLIRPGLEGISHAFKQISA